MNFRAQALASATGLLGVPLPAGVVTEQRTVVAASAAGGFGQRTGE
jgi:hypothetical protein